MCALKSFPSWLSKRWNGFCIGSASDEIRSTYAHCSAYFEWWFWNGLNMSFYVKHARKWVSHWLSTPKIWLLVGSACAKIAYLFAKHAQNCLLAGWAYAKIILVSRPISPVLRLCSLSPVLCLVSNVSVPCLLSSVSCLTSLSLASRPLSPVLVLCSLSLVSVPCSFSLVPYTLSHIICPLSLSPSLTPIKCQCPLFCGSILQFLSLFLCFLFSFPPSLVLLSFIRVFLRGHSEERIEKYAYTARNDWVDAVRSSCLTPSSELAGESPLQS